MHDFYLYPLSKWANSHFGTTDDCSVESVLAATKSGEFERGTNRFWLETCFRMIGKGDYLLIFFGKENSGLGVVACFEATSDPYIDWAEYARSGKKWWVDLRIDRDATGKLMVRGPGAAEVMKVTGPVQSVRPLDQPKHAALVRKIRKVTGL